MWLNPPMPWTSTTVAWGGRTASWLTALYSGRPPQASASPAAMQAAWRMTRTHRAANRKAHRSLDGCESFLENNYPNQRRHHRMANLKGSKTHENLKAAFAGESQANRRYLYFAKQADVEGRPDIAGLFRDTAEGETGHAHGHLEYLQEVGDPATGEPIGDTEKNLKAAVAGETYEYTQMYPGFARQARDEGFDEIAEWFETLAKAEKSHAGRFAKGLQQVKAEG